MGAFFPENMCLVKKIRKGGYPPIKEKLPFAACLMSPVLGAWGSGPYEGFQEYPQSKCGELFWRKVALCCAVCFVLARLWVKTNNGVLCVALWLQVIKAKIVFHKGNENLVRDSQRRSQPTECQVPSQTGCVQFSTQFVRTVCSGTSPIHV